MQILYSGSDEDRIKLTSAMLFVTLKRCGGFVVVRQEEIAEAFSTDIMIEHDKLNDGRLRIRAVDPPTPPPVVPVETKPAKRKPAAKKAKTKAKKGKR